MIRRVGILLCMVACVPAQVVAQGAAVAPDSANVIVLPFANYSGRQDAMSQVLPVFYDKLDSAGLRVVSHDELRPLLRERRIRVVGEISGYAMDVLREETGARLAVVGSIDVYEPDRSFEVMISARLVDLETRDVLTVITVGKTVQETEQLFGRGRAEVVEEVVTPVVADFIAAMGPPMRGEEAHQDRYHKCGLVAVVPLDDYSDRRHGAEVLQNLLMSELIARDWSVVEPGVVREILLEYQQMARGGVSLEVLGILRSRIGVCFVVTGELAEFRLAPGATDMSVPRIDYGLRLIDARESRLVASLDLFRDGREGETFFERGREYSMARLARETTQDVVRWVEEEGDK